MIKNAEVIIVQNQEQSWRAGWLLNCAQSNNIKNVKKRSLGNGGAQEMIPGYIKILFSDLGVMCCPAVKSFAYFGAKGANFVLPFF